jgi:hypothetical protein
LLIRLLPIEFDAPWRRLGKEFLHLPHAHIAREAVGFGGDAALLVDSNLDSLFAFCHYDLLLDNKAGLQAACLKFAGRNFLPQLDCQVLTTSSMVQDTNRRE